MSGRNEFGPWRAEAGFMDGLLNGKFRAKLIGRDDSRNVLQPPR